MSNNKLEHGGGVQDVIEVLDVPASSGPGDGTAKETFSVGTLVYTKIGLMYLFAWLLWGDFCFTIMEGAPGILSVNIKSMGASNTITALFLTTIPTILNATVCPIISFRSDRMRTKRGRRIPILLVATPPITLFMIAIGYSREIGGWLQHMVGGVIGTSQTSMTLGFLGFAIIGYQFFNMFTASVFYYLFNDVVPEAYLARCMALFRAVGTLAGALFNFFVLKYAQTHMQEIFLGAALLYFVAFMTMCFAVKEGEYPPPPELIGKNSGVVAQMRTFFSECFTTHRFYWYFYLSNTFYGGACVMGAFGLLFNLSLGLNLGILGKIGGIAGIISTILLYPAGMLSDKYHALRMMMFAMAGMMLVSSMYLIWLFIPNPSYKLVLTISVIISFTLLPFNTMYAAAQGPMFMRLLPKDRYGQFCSADAMVRSLATIVFSLCSGLYLDFFKKYYHSNEFYYRWIPVWTISFYAVSMFFLLKLYKEWKKLGGDKDFVPPA